MPLSEHEQRLLDQIERALYAEDPKFASSVRATDLRSHYRRRIVKSGVLFVLGMFTLLAGVISKIVLVGVLGFVVMLCALVFGLTSWQRLLGHRDNRSQHVAAVQKPAQPRRGSLVARMEERWRRRWDQRGGR